MSGDIVATYNVHVTLRASDPDDENPDVPPTNVELEETIKEAVEASVNLTATVSAERTDK
jgi:hypothetical protein